MMESTGLYPRHTDYKIGIKFVDKKNAEIDEDAKLELYGENGLENIYLRGILQKDIKRGGQATCIIKDVKNVGQIKGARIIRTDDKMQSEWYAESINIQNMRTKEEKTFSVHSWLTPFTWFSQQTCLPQFDDDPEERQKSIKEEAKYYPFPTKNDRFQFPVISEYLPWKETFSFKYEMFLAWEKFDGMTFRRLGHYGNNWTSLNDLKNYTDENLPAVNDWDEDAAFGLQRLSGCCPDLIRLCRSVPYRLAVNETMLLPFLEGKPLHQALAAKRLFYTDLAAMEGLPCVSPDVKCCAPIALFFLNSSDNLVPIAIQLFQEGGAANNPVFVPSDSPNLWTLAKMWYNNAEANYHQTLSHLCFTHLMMEGVVMATHRNLSGNHPIFQLLGPHFLFLMAINNAAVKNLIDDGGLFDKVMSLGTRGMSKLIEKRADTWALDVDGTLPENLKKRGVEKGVLSNYPYRDDGLLYYNAINKYVSDYVSLYYGNNNKDNSKLLHDNEIQNWVKELTKSVGDGFGIKGVPSNNGHFETMDQLIKTLTAIIYTCSVTHAAVNFPQYDQYTFLPKYPSKLRGNPPTDKSEKTDQDIVDALPDVSTAFSMMSLARFLSQKGTNSLGDFEHPFISDDAGIKIVKRFQEDIAEIGKAIYKANLTRQPPYKYLEPEGVPNSISI